jgi:hypothetical protein
MLIAADQSNNLRAWGWQGVTYNAKPVGKSTGPDPYKNGEKTKGGGGGWAFYGARRHQRTLRTKGERFLNPAKSINQPEGMLLRKPNDANKR